VAQRNLPLNREWGLPYKSAKKIADSSYIKKETTSPSSMRIVVPVVMVEASPVFFSSPFKPYIVPTTYKVKDKSKSLLYRKLKKESLLIVNDSIDKFHLTIDPLFNFEAEKNFTRTPEVF